MISLIKNNIDALDAAAQTLCNENENLGLDHEDVIDTKRTNVEFIVTDSAVKISLDCHEEL